MSTIGIKYKNGRGRMTVDLKEFFYHKGNYDDPNWNYVSMSIKQRVKKFLLFLKKEEYENKEAVRLMREYVEQQKEFWEKSWKTAEKNFARQITGSKEFRSYKSECTASKRYYNLFQMCADILEAEP